MKNISVLSSLLFILSIVVGVIGYILVFTQFDTVWRNFDAIFLLCVITFAVAFLVIIGGFLNDRRLK